MSLNVNLLLPPWNHKQNVVAPQENVFEYWYLFFQTIWSVWYSFFSNHLVSVIFFLYNGFINPFLNMEPTLFIACLQDLRGLVCLHEYCTRLPTSPCHKKPISLLLENMNMYLTWTLEIYRSLGTEIPKRFYLRVPRFFELSTRFLGDLFVTWLVRHLFQPTSVNLLRSISS